ncbi:MAG TPA: hypothetical protein VIE40_05560 [Dehalococcoidia bacterium]
MERKMRPGEDKTRTPYNDPTYNPKIEGANPESVDADMPEQGEPDERDRSRMAEPTPPERVIPRDGNKQRNDKMNARELRDEATAQQRTRSVDAMNPPLLPEELERESEHDEPGA